MQYPWDHTMATIRRNRWIRRHRLDIFGFRRSDKIADLGCGDGLDIHILTGLGVNNIVGVDISPALLAKAKQRNPGIRFINASAEKLPFPAGRFDAVLVDSMIYHLVGNDRALKEIRRVLCPGGRLCIVDMHASWARNLFDAVTLSSISCFVPYLQKRKEAFLAEREAMTRWRISEHEFFRTLPRTGFRTLYCHTDFLSIICEYQKTGRG